MTATIITGDALQALQRMASASVDCIVTSPPYWRLKSCLPRDHPNKGLEIGQENEPDDYATAVTTVLREAKRLLKKDGTAWINIADSWIGESATSEENSRTREGNPDPSRSGTRRLVKRGAGLKPKDLAGIPWRLAAALRDDGWWVRSDIIWVKQSPMPSGARDRPINAYEHIFLLTRKRGGYWYDADALRGIGPDGETGKHAGLDVWYVPSEAGIKGQPRAMPAEIARRCIAAGCRPGGTVLDPFGGSGTTSIAADRLRRNSVMIELHLGQAALARTRVESDAALFASVSGKMPADMAPRRSGVRQPRPPVQLDIEDAVRAARATQSAR
jgi:site-specific DNA-methyltransferase (adenine-specific)/site-specific DNA-methyltransferase (cytosine-N4-specific)